MSKTLKKLTILLVVGLVAVGGILGGLSATARTADEDAIKAEVEAAAGQFVQTLNTSDGELLDSLWLQSDKTTWFSATQPLRIDGWPHVREGFAGLLSLPPGSVSLVARQGRVDLFGDDVALFTAHFVLNIRPPGPPVTTNGRFTGVLQKIDGKWLRVHTHVSALP